MKTLKITQFENKINHIVEDQKNKLVKETEEHLITFRSLSFEVFSYDKPYKGELKNKIFLTYCDHYHANSGLYMQIGQLIHPHNNMEDRGYIKGVSTDLEGYLKLRLAKNLNHNLVTTANIYHPHFRKSKHKEQYMAECNNIIQQANDTLNLVVEKLLDRMNQELHNITGCSLLYYINNQL